MISKQQYRNILLQQMKEHQQRKQMEKSERRRSPAPQQQQHELLVVGQHKKLHTHQQQERPLVYSNLHDDNSRKSNEQQYQAFGYFQGLRSQQQLDLSQEISNGVQDGKHNKQSERDQPTNELNKSGSLNDIMRIMSASPRNKIFSEVAPSSPPIKEIYQQGARNLLKLENIEQTQIDNKHKKRLEMQKMLKEQMEEIEQRKKNQRERRITEEKREFESNQRYIQELQRRAQNENRKKEALIERQSTVLNSHFHAGASAKITEVKVLPDENPTQPKLSFKEFKAKRKLKESLVAQAAANHDKGNSSLPKLPVVESRQYRSEIPLQNHPNEHSRKSAQSNRVPNQRPPTITESEFISSHESESQREKSNNSNSSHSNDTAKRQQYRKMQLMIARIRKDIKLQELVFRKQIEKARRQAVQAVHEKKQLEQEFTRLKEQMLSLGHEQSMDEYYQFDVKKFNRVDSQQRSPTNLETKRRRPATKKQSMLAPMRPNDHEVLRSKQYRVQDPVVDESCMRSLLCESKKIPLSIVPHNRNEVLTMSKIEDYAVDGSRLKQSQFRKKQRVRTDDNSMNEFLSNPYGITGQQPMEVSTSQKEQLIDFYLSSVDSSVANEVSALVERQKKVVAAHYPNHRPSKFILRHSSVKSNRLQSSDQESSNSETLNRQHRRYRKVIRLQESSQVYREPDQTISPIRQEPLPPSESQIALQQDFQ